MKTIVPVILLLSVCSLHAADCTDTKIVAGGGFFYSLCGVPDVDQRRAAGSTVLGLPNNGEMYCLPASAMNFFAFLGNHPWAPIPEPGSEPSNWQSSSAAVYNDMTMNLQALGALMNTDPDTGTTGFDALDGMQQWLEDNGVDEAYLVSLFYAEGDYSPGIIDIAQAGLAGAYVMPNMGFYTNAYDAEEKTRYGGHVVSLVGAAGVVSEDYHSITMHDPNNTTSGMSQASFYRKESVTQEIDGTFDGNYRTQTIVYEIEDAYIDGYQEIRFNWSFVYNKFHDFFVAVHPFVHPEEPVTKGYKAPGQVTDVAIHPQRTRHPYLVQGTDVIWQLDELTGESSVFGTLKQPRALEFGGAERQLYVLLKDQIVALDWNGREKSRVTPGDGIDQIAWDASNKQLLALSLRSGRIYRFDTKLARLGAIGIPAVPGVGNAYMGADARTGVVWLLREGTSAALRIERSAELVSLDGVRRAESLAVGHNGFVYVSDGDQMVVYDTRGRRQPGSRFNGMPGGGVMDFARSFSNFDPRVHTGPGWRNLLPRPTGDSSR